MLWQKSDRNYSSDFSGGKNGESSELHIQSYGQAVNQAIIRAGFIFGAETALKQLAQRYPLYLNSLTPEADLRFVVQGLKAAHYFQEIFGYLRERQGSESQKVQNLRRVLTRESLVSENVLLVGDSEVDRSTASTCGCPFIGIANQDNQWRGREFPVIDSVAQLPQTISRIFVG